MVGRILSLTLVLETERWSRVSLSLPSLYPPALSSSALLSARYSVFRSRPSRRCGLLGSRNRGTPTEEARWRRRIDSSVSHVAPHFFLADFHLFHSGDGLNHYGTNPLWYGIAIASSLSTARRRIPPPNLLILFQASASCSLLFGFLQI